MPAALAQRKPGELSPYIAPENLNTYRIGLKCFFEEGRALASIYHPNIVRVLNFFRANETVYMVMHYESGRSLQEHVLRNRNKEQKDVLSERFIRRVFRAGDERPARSAFEPPAAPGRQARQHLPADGRHADPARLRRRAADAAA